MIFDGFYEIMIVLFKNIPHLQIACSLLLRVKKERDNSTHRMTAKNTQRC